jgi:hypothetical protein
VNLPARKGETYLKAKNQGTGEFASPAPTTPHLHYRSSYIAPATHAVLASRNAPVR